MKTQTTDKLYSLMAEYRAHNPEVDVRFVLELLLNGVTAITDIAFLARDGGSSPPMRTSVFDTITLIVSQQLSKIYCQK